jgi:hypothetical protein
MASVPYDIDSILVAESGRIGPDIYRKTLNTSPWLKLVKQGAWPDEMGDQLTVLTYERSLPANTLSWEGVATNGSNGGGGSETGSGTCLPPVQTINFAQTARQYSLAQTALESPPLCVNDLRFPFRRQEQLRMMFDILAENTSYAWQDRYRNEYFRNCGHKVVAYGNSSSNVYLPENTTITVDPNTTSGIATLFPASSGDSILPSSYLTQGILDRVYMKLIRDGAGNNPLDRANGRPQFGLICSPETSDRLIRSDADQRDDFRYSTRVSELLAPLGIERPYRGFFHMVDDFAPRYKTTVVGGKTVLQRVLPYASAAATYGNKFDINPAYEDAEYEVSFVFHMDVIEALIPKPITSPGGNTKFDPVSYRGDFKWKNIPHPTENPDGTIGFFRGVLSSGTKPIRPEWGYAILHLRCANDLGLLDCAGESGVLTEE